MILLLAGIVIGFFAGMILMAVLAMAGREDAYLQGRKDEWREGPR